MLSARRLQYPLIIKAIAPIACAEPNKPALRADHWAHTAHYAYAARAARAARYWLTPLT
jgi:hypothetical protein